MRLINKMKSNSFYKRFKNRSQFISKEGSFELGKFSVARKNIIKSKIHSDYDVLRFSDISPISPNTNNNSISDTYQKVNQSCSITKLPTLSNIHTRKIIPKKTFPEINK